MMTPQEVASSTFPKATLGGYNMAAVDVFLDKLTEDYTTIYKENATLKAKIKVLVDKMEEYHSMEDTMRSTLLTAQKMASSMISEAEEKRNALLADAEGDAILRKKEIADEIAAEERRLEAVRTDIDRQIEAEKERLALAQRELVTFLNAARKLCDKQIAMIERIPALEILPAAQAEQKSVEPEIPEINMPEPVVMEEPVSDVPTDAEATAAAMAEVVEELGGDAASLMENMRSVIDSFANEGESDEKKDEAPFEIGFDDANDLFDDDPPAADEPKKEQPADDDRYDNFENESGDETRVLNLKDLKFGRNYNKD